MRHVVSIICSVLAFMAVPVAAQTVQGTAFTYQGELRQSNQPVTGSVPMVFTLWNDPTLTGAGSQVGPTLSFDGTGSDPPPVPVDNGIFTVTLDFGSTAFITATDEATWLQVSVNGTVLSPRTQIQNSPYALTSQLAYNVLANSIGTTQINSAQVQRRVTGSCGTGSAISVINQDGTVSCQAAGGTITGVTPAAGSGLTGGGTTGSVSIGTDTSVLQKRVGGTCPSGFSIRAVNADGTVACLAAGTGTVTSITAGNGLTGGTITSTGTIGVDTSIVALSANTWGLSGNAGVTNGYLGTIDSNPLTFKVNGTMAGQLQPTVPSGGFFDEPNVIFGSSANTVAAGVVGATIGGGGARYTSGNFNNSISGNYGTVSGGTSNAVSGFGAAVGGGNANNANGTYSVVSGGWINLASADYAVVPGGYGNKAGGFASFAGGSYAHVRSAVDTGSSGDNGTFIWSDYSGGSTNQFTSTGINQFLIRAGGGVGINTTPFIPDVELTIRGSATAPSANADIVLLPRSSNYGFNLSVSGTSQSDASFAIESTNFTSYLSIDATGNVSVNQGNLTLAGSAAQAYKPGGGAWSAPSDVRLKRDIRSLDHELDKLLQLRGVSFEYAHPDNELHPAGRFVGFIAQDVQAVFPDWIGQTPDGYLTVGPKGFEAMTVEALRELRAEKDAEIADLRTRLDELARQVKQLQRAGQP